MIIIRQSGKCSDRAAIEISRICQEREHRSIEANDKILTVPVPTQASPTCLRKFSTSQARTALILTGLVTAIAWQLIAIVTLFIKLEYTISARICCAIFSQHTYCAGHSRNRFGEVVQNSAGLNIKSKAVSVSVRFAGPESCSIGIEGKTEYCPATPTVNMYYIAISVKAFNITPICNEQSSTPVTRWKEPNSECIIQNPRQYSKIWQLGSRHDIISQDTPSLRGIEHRSLIDREINPICSPFFSPACTFLEQRTELRI